MANLWAKKGIRYLSFRWKDENNQIILDKGDKNITQVIEGINRAHENGESVLVHSIRGQNRSIVILAAYFMLRYHWTANKALEYMRS